MTLSLRLKAIPVILSLIILPAGTGAVAGERPAPDELGPPFEVGGEPVFGPLTGGMLPAVASDGANCLAVWEAWVGTRWNILAGRVTGSGAALDTLGIWMSRSPEQQWEPQVTFNGTYYLVAWSETSDGSWDDSNIFGGRVTTTGEVLDPEGIPICTSPGPQYDVSLASDGESWLVVWTQKRWDVARDIYGARVSSDGTVLDPEGIHVSTSANRLGSPDVAFGAGRYLVVWEDARRGALDVYGSRIDLEGNVIDPKGIPISRKLRAQTEPAVDFDETDYVVAWLDSRAAEGRNCEIYGTRVSPLGDVADANGSPISTGPALRHSLSIASGGGDYAVVWGERQAADTLKSDVKAVRVASTGEILEPDAIVIATSDVFETNTDIVLDGTEYTIVWEDYSGDVGPSIYSTRLSQTGLITDPEGTAVALGPNGQTSPRAASDGDDYLAVWTDYRDRSRQLYGTRVTASGATLDPYGIAISSAPSIISYPDVAFDGANYVVAYGLMDSSFIRSDIYLSRISRSGTVLDTLLIAQSTPETPLLNPKIAFDGTNYMVIWEQGFRSAYYGYVYKVAGTRVSLSGDVLDPDWIHIPLGVSYLGASHPEVEFGGTSYLVVVGGGGVRLSPSGKVLDSEAFAVSPPQMYVGLPALASGGTDFMAVWEVRRNSQYDVFGARIDSSGATLDPWGIEISAAAGDQRAPNVTFDGTYYMVTWIDRRSDEGDVYGCRVTASGEVLDPDGLPIATGTGDQSSPAMARGAAGKLLTVYSSAAGNAPYNSNRIWARLWNPVTPQAAVRLAAAPNPFRSSVRMSYSLPREAEVSLAVFDAAGRLVRTIVRGRRGPGWNYETWDGRDEEGRNSPSGVYFARIQCKCGSTTAKCVLLR